eukprot:gene5400-10797_t
MGDRIASARLRKEYINLKKDPVPSILACPLEKNILEWRFVLQGSVDSDYFGGHYFGKLKFPPEYPLGPPSIMMITPSGRFKCTTRICMSMSDFHPESWCPSWSVGTILTGLLSFMNSNELTTGGLDVPAEERRRLALASKSFNATDPIFRELFGDADTVEQAFKDIENIIAVNTKARAAVTTPSSSTRAITNLEKKPSASDIAMQSAQTSLEAMSMDTATENNSSTSQDTVSKAAKRRARAKKAVASKSSEATTVAVLVEQSNDDVIASNQTI